MKAATTMLRTPVALFVFNRSDTTERVFTAIARAKPATLLVVADGPPADRPREADKCTAVRAIVDRVDWDCRILRNYSEVNLGCRQRVSSGLDWVFEQCDEAIILEDDCVPEPSFFRFCAELLTRYRHDERIMMITGTNFQFGRSRTPHSYFFSCHTPIWGWASWRRAWRHYDVEMAMWPALRHMSWLTDILRNRSAAEYWRNVFDLAHAGSIDTWDYQWKFACWAQRGLTVVPNMNLVSNIGFDEHATHTVDSQSLVAGLPTTPIRFPLRHPPCVVRHVQADRFHQESLFLTARRRAGLYARVRGILSRIVRDRLRPYGRYARSG